jgi:hypothetical protein
MMELPIEIFLQIILLAHPPKRYEIILNSYICRQYYSGILWNTENSNDFGPSTGRKLKQITQGIPRNTPVTRNTVNLTPKTVTPQNSN